jgi:hypothetical protein
MPGLSNGVNGKGEAFTVLKEVKVLNGCKKIKERRFQK